MRIGAILSPIDSWPAVAEAARAADDAGLDAVGLWDHYHSAQPDWGYICGWSAYGAIAATTRSVKLVPMVLNTLHYELGVIAKESSLLAASSDGRFEVALGAGDWPASFTAWGRPFPSADKRRELVAETARALKLVWSGEPVSFNGRQIQLRDAICAPPPGVLPRILIGAGQSPRAVQLAAEVADEINVYDDADLTATARAAADASDRSVTVSVFAAWDWDKWPADPRGEIDRFAAAGVDRVFVSIGGEDMVERVRTLAGLTTNRPA
jgi:alkanesulfonate monooxygenase SsuD/methylene tetrahydromethanopterin reductase-like flavin-dependent oxidoreductase (luciferase family)